MQKIQTKDEQFHDGDGRTEMGTVVTAKFLNDVQNELCHVIESAGIDLDATDNTQLLQAFLAVLRKTLSAGDYASKSEVRKKLDKTAKAADADKLDGHDAGYFATSDAVEGKVSKTGDRMTGHLTFDNINNPTFDEIDTPLSVIDDIKILSRDKNVNIGLIYGRMKEIENLETNIYLEQRKEGESDYRFYIRLAKSGSSQFWSFRSDGHLYGPHGKIVNAKDESFSIGSYTIAIVRSHKSLPRNNLVSGAEFFDSDIGGDLGNDFSAERWWLGNRNVGGLPGTWRVMNPVNAYGDYRSNNSWCTINLIKRVA